MMSKDEAYSCIRSRKTVKITQAKYNGNNAYDVFGPPGLNIYGRNVVERKDRPNSYRVEIKYKPQTYGKTQNIRISLGKHENLKSAESICDRAIEAWLLSRKKYAPQKRSRTKWITKMSARNLTPTKCNTPKRSTNALRRGRSAGPITDDVDSPVAPNMLKTPVAKKVLQKKKHNRGVKKKYIQDPNVCLHVLFVFICLVFFLLTHIFVVVVVVISEG